MKAEESFASLSHANVSPRLERQIAANKFGVLWGSISHKDIASVTLGILPMIPGLSRLKLRVEWRHYVIINSKISRTTVLLPLCSFLYPALRRRALPVYAVQIFAENYASLKILTTRLRQASIGVKLSES